LQNTTVIIPVSNNREAWRYLVKQLSSLPFIKEVIVVSTEEAPLDVSSYSVSWHKSLRGRARQMNLATLKVATPFIWFLHADTRLSKDFNIQTQDLDFNTLYYFHLKFYEASPLMKINEWGLWFRSTFLKIPFGDQGFLVSHSLFQQLGCYNEAATYGEDHLFVWSARKAGAKVVNLGPTLLTSARKYQNMGWLKTTCKHLWLTARQAFSQAFLKGKS
jgi:hypothetical protein